MLPKDTIQDAFLSFLKWIKVDAAFPLKQDPADPIKLKMNVMFSKSTYLAFCKDLFSLLERIRERREETDLQIKINIGKQQNKYT